MKKILKTSRNILAAIGVIALTAVMVCPGLEKGDKNVRRKKVDNVDEADAVHNWLSNKYLKRQ